MSLTLVRPFVVVTDDQRTDAWRQARLGKLTGSRAGDMLARLKNPKDESARRRDLRVQLVLERITGCSQEDGYQSKDMQRGIEMEADAFAAYEALTGNVVRRTGFLSHPTLAAGCSLDGQVDNFAGLIELKCPKSATHLEYLRSRIVPADYLAQVRHGLWITGAAWADFVSYDPRFPEALRLLITRIHMSDAERDSYALLVRQFLSQVDDEEESVRRMAIGAAA